MLFRSIGEFEAHIIRDELVRAATLPLIVKLDKSPALPGKTPVRVVVGELNYWDISGVFTLAEVPATAIDASTPTPTPTSDPTTEIIV